MPCDEECNPHPNPHPHSNVPMPCDEEDARIRRIPPRVVRQLDAGFKQRSLRPAAKGHYHTIAPHTAYYVATITHQCTTHRAAYYVATITHQCTTTPPHHHGTTKPPHRHTATPQQHCHPNTTTPPHHHNALPPTHHHTTTPPQRPHQHAALTRNASVPTAVS